MLLWTLRTASVITCILTRACGTSILPTPNSQRTRSPRASWPTRSETPGLQSARLGPIGVRLGVLLVVGSAEKLLESCRMGAWYGGLVVVCSFHTPWNGVGGGKRMISNCQAEGMRATSSLKLLPIVITWYHICICCCLYRD